MGLKLGEFGKKPAKMSPGVGGKRIYEFYLPVVFFYTGLFWSHFCVMLRSWESFRIVGIQRLR